VTTKGKNEPPKKAKAEIPSKLIFYFCSPPEPSYKNKDMLMSSWKIRIYSSKKRKENRMLT
jgi:hypothetical protein